MMLQAIRVLKQTSLALLTGGLLAACSENRQAEPPSFPEPGSQGAQLLVERCGICHQPPQPSLYEAAKWPGVLHRMQMRMKSRGYQPLPENEFTILLGWLQRHAAVEGAQ